MKNKKRSTKRKFGLIEVVMSLAALLVLVTVLFIFYVHESRKPQEIDLAAAVHAIESLPGVVRGVGRPIDSTMTRDDGSSPVTNFQNVPGLTESLRAHEDEHPCGGLEGRFKQVVLGVTEDKSQALIGNGCGGAGTVRSFMIKQGDEWQRIGSWNGKFGGQYDTTDNFNELLDTPSCEVVEKYDIQKSIAPVCFRMLPGVSNLYSGDVANYTYELR